MCGIVGVISKLPRGINFGTMECFAEMLITDSIRGPDSTGVFSVTGEGNASYLKLATHPYNLIKSREYMDWQANTIMSGQAAIGHNRKATEGAIVNANAHPFTFGNIILVHNGHIGNFRSLLNIKEREKLKVEVDSHAAAILLARNEPERILKEMTGAFTFVWYDVLQKKMFAIRNEERPLSIATTEREIFIASEHLMLHWLLSRRGIKAEISNFKAGILLSMDLNDGFKFDHKKIDLYVPKIYTAPPATISTQDQGRLLTLKPSSDINKLEPKDQFNIHYGGDELIRESDFEHQQIIFSIEDFKQVGKDSNQWQLWGHALDSDHVLVVTNVRGTEDEIEAIGYTPHLIGFIRRIKEASVKGSREQEVIVTDVRAVELTMCADGKWLTGDHYAYLKTKTQCRCQVDCDVLDSNDLYVDRNGCQSSFICKWCAEADKEELAKTTASAAV